MSVKIKRFQANESDFTRFGRTRTQIEVPGSIGITDLTASKIVCDMHAETLENGVPINIPVSFGNGQMIGAQSLIRNARVHSRQHGLLNERRQQNVLSANLDWFSTSRAGEDVKSLTGSSTNASYGISRVNSIPDSPFVLCDRPTAVNVVADKMPIGRRAEVNIPWRHIDNMSTMAQFPNMAVGDLTYTIEFEDQIECMFPARMPTRAGVQALNMAAVASKIGLPASPITLLPSVSSGYHRPPKVGDIVYAAYWQETSNAKSFLAQQDVITDVSVVAGKYVVIVADGFSTTAATEDVVTLSLFYYGAQETNPTNVNYDGDNVIPQGKNCIANASFEIGAADSPISFNVGSAGGITLTNNTITADALASCIWYVGAPVQLTLVLASGNETDQVLVHNAHIETLKVATGGTLEVVLDVPADVNEAMTITSLALCHRDVFNTSTDNTSQKRITTSYVIDEVYLQMSQINLLPSQMTSVVNAMKNVSIPFIDQMLIQRNCPTTSAHTEVISALPNTIGLAVMTPQNLTFLSGTDGVAYYRFSINGRNTTNQDIYVGSAQDVGRSIHNVLLKQFFGNMNKPLLKYDAPLESYATVSAQTETHHIYPLVLPAVPDESIVQVQLFCNDGDSMNNKNIFYLFFRARQLVLSNGMVSMSV
jgi:hypothetical protein